MNINVVLISAVLLSGCAGVLPTMPVEPTKQELLSYDYGEYPSDYKGTIESYIKPMLKDPESAQFTNYSSPKKDWLSDNQLSGRTYIGWLICVDVNAKNSYGGYVGRKTHFLIIKGNEVLYSQRDQYTKMVANGMMPPNEYPIKCN